MEYVSDFQKMLSFRSSQNVSKLKGEQFLKSKVDMLENVQPFHSTTFIERNFINAQDYISIEIH